MNLREWANSHLDKPADHTVHAILMDLTKQGSVNRLVDILGTTRYRAARLIQAAEREGYRF